LLIQGKRNERGTVAITFALATLPMIAMVALGIDYSRASGMRAAMQQYADAAALNAGVGKMMNIRKAEASGNPNAETDTDPWKSLQEVLAQFEHNYPGQFSSFSIDTSWVSESEFQIRMNATMMPAIWSGVPDLPVSILTVAEITQYQKPQDKPKVVFLDSDAADYNRLYVYCYEKKDPDKKSWQQKPVEQRRRNFTAISDNAGSTYKYTMPECTAKETLSIMLHNVANARGTKSRWDSSPNRYYSDTETPDGVQEYNFGYKMVETVVCDKLTQCKPKTQGGIVPTGAGRNPAENKKACLPGKFIYHGFEDRPSGGDRDFDDIRMVMECPKNEVGTRVVLAR
jgi:hypothetical protein